MKLLKYKILIFLSLFSTSILQSQEEIVKTFSEKVNIKRIVLLNDKQAIVLTKEDASSKLVNTLLLIENQKVTGKYIGSTSLDHIIPYNESTIEVFAPANTLLSMSTNFSQLTLKSSTRIPFFNYKLLFSTSFEIGVLWFINGTSVYFNQGESDAINKTDSNIIPNYYVFKDGKKVRINSSNSEVIYSHWPTYSEMVMPPQTYIRIVKNKIVFVISNIGKVYSFDTKSQKIEEFDFPRFKEVQSWSMFYDHIADKIYYVSYMGNNLFNIYKRGETGLVKILGIYGFYDSIADGWALQKIRDEDNYIYKKIKLEQ